LHAALRFERILSETIPWVCFTDAKTMSNAERTAICYLRLATISRAKQQLAGCDRFLVLAGTAACRAGWLDVAEICRDRVLEHNPHHMLRRWDTLPEALRSDEFPVFLKQLDRFCPAERAEMLLSELDQSADLSDEASWHEIALEQLADPAWKE
jgi:hypothetical protein